MADIQKLEDLLKSGLELFRAKRFSEADPIFRQVLTLEPRHTGAAYMLAITLYFSGAFAEALHMFKQLTAPGTPLAPQQVVGLRELSGYAQYELLRLKYWENLHIADPRKISKELGRRGLKVSSLEAFHLYLANGKGAEWLQKYRIPAGKVDLRVTTRANQIMILRDGRDADDTIGAHLEAVQGARYIFIPLNRIKTLELGSIKRWMPVQVEYQDLSRETVMLPLTYRNSISQKARGVQEGAETITVPIEGAQDSLQAFGQKQFRSETGRIGLAQIMRMEIAPRSE